MNRVEQAIAGDESALMELLQAECARARRGIASTIPRSLRSLLDADDVLQQACVDAFRSIQTAHLPDEQSFAAWFGTIVRRNLIDAIRAFQSQKRGGGRRGVPVTDPHQSLSILFGQLFAQSLTASRQVIAREALQKLEQAVARLPEHYRLVVQQYDLQQKPIESVAREVGRSIGAAFMIRSRAHRLLAAMLESSTA